MCSAFVFTFLRPKGIPDYLTFSLTGEYVGDAGTASLLGILNLKNLSWWPEALNILGICPKKLSKPLSPGTLAEPLTETGSKLLGLNPQTTFVVGSCDQHVAAIGAGLGQIAEMSESTGTALACIKYTDKYNPEKNVCMGAGVNESSFFQITTTQLPVVQRARIPWLWLLFPADASGTV